MNYERFDGRIAVVTGAARGIGAAIVKRLADEGAKVMAVDVHEDIFEMDPKEIFSTGGEVQPWKCDVSRSSDVAELVAAIVEKHKSIDILINNAAIIRNNYLVKMSEEDWNQVIAVNLTGPFNMIHAIAPIMINQRGGAIVNIASGSSAGMPGQANYASSKAGLYGLTKTASLELAKFHIRVNAVSPGFIVTKMTAQLAKRANTDLQTFVATAAKAIPLGRAGVPDDVSSAVAFLCSDDASFITGQILNVRGGPGPASS